VRLPGGGRLAGAQQRVPEFQPHARRDGAVEFAEPDHGPPVPGGLLVGQARGRVLGRVDDVAARPRRFGHRDGAGVVEADLAQSPFATGRRVGQQAAFPSSTKIVGESTLSSMSSLDFAAATAPGTAVGRTVLGYRRGTARRPARA
jgi:hypothetical protein